MDVTARNNTQRDEGAPVLLRPRVPRRPAGRHATSEINGRQGREVRRSRSARRTPTLLRIDFGSRLYSGKSRDVHASPSTSSTRATPADRDVRVGPSLVTLPVWAHASNGAKGGTVTVRVPEGYDVAVENGAFDKTTTTDRRRAPQLSTTALAKPLDFFAFVSAQRAADVRGRRRSTSRPATRRSSCSLRGWDGRSRLGRARRRPVHAQPAGPARRDRAAVAARGAAHRPGGGRAAAPTATPGCSTRPRTAIEVAYWADRAGRRPRGGPRLVQRRAARRPLGERGVRVAVRVSARREGDRGRGDGPGAHRRPQGAAIPLNAWAIPPLAGEGTPEAPARRPSRTRGGRDRGVRLRGLARARRRRSPSAPATTRSRAVWADAATGVGAYQPGAGLGAATVPETPARPRRLDGAADWRALLDLLEAETGADFTDLWREWVDPARGGARCSTPAPPRAVVRADARPRRRLGAARARSATRSARGSSTTAERLMADARTVLAQRGALESMAAQRRHRPAGRHADACSRRASSSTRPPAPRRSATRWSRSPAPPRRGRPTPTR